MDIWQFFLVTLISRLKNKLKILVTLLLVLTLSVTRFGQKLNIDRVTDNDQKKQADIS